MILPSVNNELTIPDLHSSEENTGMDEEMTEDSKLHIDIPSPVLGSSRTSGSPRTFDSPRLFVPPQLVQCNNSKINNWDCNTTKSHSRKKLMLAFKSKDDSNPIEKGKEFLFDFGVEAFGWIAIADEKGILKIAYPGNGQEIPRPVADGGDKKSFRIPDKARKAINNSFPNNYWKLTPLDKKKLKIYHEDRLVFEAEERFSINTNTSQGKKRRKADNGKALDKSFDEKLFDRGVIVYDPSAESRPNSGEWSHHVQGTDYGIKNNGDGKFKTVEVRCDPKFKDKMKVMEKYEGGPITVYECEVDGQPRIAFNAEEIRKIVPKAVRVQKDGSLMLDLVAIVAIVTQVLQETIAQVEENKNIMEDTKKRVHDNEKGIKDMQNRIEKMEKFQMRTRSKDKPYFSSRYPADADELKTMTPTKEKTMRSYQQKALNKFKTSDTGIILNIPTGTGKTLVAVRAIDWVREEAKRKKVLFIVPTQALATQQAKVCWQEAKIVSGSRDITVATIFGGQGFGDYKKDDWKLCMQKADVLVGTAEEIRKAFSQGYLQVKNFSLIIFDECHNARGNHPMARFLQDSVLPAMKQGIKVHILGLTASFAGGKIPNNAAVEKQRRELENIMQVNIFAPTMPNEFKGDQTITPVRFGSEVWSKEKFQREMNLVHNILEQNGFDKKLVTKSRNHSERVMNELGGDALACYWREGMLKELAAKAEYLKNMEDVGAKAKGSRIETLVIRSRDAVQKIMEEKDMQSETYKFHSGKFKRLLVLLRNNPQTRTKTIIFVETKSLVYPMCYVINKTFGRVCGATMGRGAMSVADRERALKEFRDPNGLRILVSTPVLEEGIDVPQCQIIIRYNNVSTTRSWIQGAGRARSRDAKMYVFENDPKLEEEKREMMEGIGRKEELAQTNHELKGGRETLLSGNGGAEWTTAEGAKITIFSAMNIVMQYAQKVFRESFDPESSMFSYDEVDGAKILVKMCVPTIEGPLWVTEDDLSTFMIKHNIDESAIRSSSAADNWNQRNLKKRLFAFFLAVKLLEKNHLEGDLEAKKLSTVELDQVVRSCRKQFKISSNDEKKQRSFSLPFDNKTLRICGNDSTKKGLAAAASVMKLDLLHTDSNEPGNVESDESLEKCKPQIECSDDAKKHVSLQPLSGDATTLDNDEKKEASRNSERETKKIILRSVARSITRPIQWVHELKQKLGPNAIQTVCEQMGGSRCRCVVVWGTERWEEEGTDTKKGRKKAFAAAAHKMKQDLLE